MAKLQASELERAPRVELLEAAASSHEPWRPNYRLNAAISVAGSLAFGLFAAWFADFIAGQVDTGFIETRLEALTATPEPSNFLRIEAVTALAPASDGTPWTERMRPHFRDLLVIRCRRYVRK